MQQKKTLKNLAKVLPDLKKNYTSIVCTLVCFSISAWNVPLQELIFFFNPRFTKLTICLGLIRPCLGKIKKLPCKACPIYIFCNILIQCAVIIYICPGSQETFHLWRLWSNLWKVNKRFKVTMDEQDPLQKCIMFPK